MFSSAVAIGTKLSHGSHHRAQQIQLVGKVRQAFVVVVCPKD